MKKYQRTLLEAKNVFISNAVVTRFEEIENLRKRPKSYEAIGPTKSESGVRKVGLSDLAVQALKEWRKELDTRPSAMRQLLAIVISRSRVQVTSPAPINKTRLNFKRVLFISIKA